MTNNVDDVDGTTLRDGEKTLSIEVSARVLRHLSRGIYRTPAGALKELVSNSYDARAQKVAISTGYPHFDKMIISDNGDGMASAQFESVVRNIGLSEKTAGDVLRLDDGGHSRRRVIGHYGIGLLAVGQLAAKLIVTSKQKGTTEGFQATIDFEQFEVSQLDAAARSVLKDEQQLEVQDAGRGSRTFPIGKCHLRPVRFGPAHRNRHFTRLELQNVRVEVYKKLSGAYRDLNEAARKSQRYVRDFAQMLRLFREREGEVRQGQYPYEKLCWELAVYCPVPYPDIKVFRTGDLHQIGQLADSYDFSVTVDGLELHKPFEGRFFTEEEYPVEQIFAWRNEPYTNKPKGPRVTGYLIYKRRIRPKALQGVLVREGGVAIGMYDSTYLEYPFNEGMKFNQLTGELYADGLAGALNIDRNSFNETDDMYLSLARWFHDKLNREVFSKIKKLQQRPEASRRGENLRVIGDVLGRYARQQGRKRAKVRFRPLGRRAGLFDWSGTVLTINRDHPDGRGSTSKLEKILLGGFLILSEDVDVDSVNEAIQSIAKLKRVSE